MRHAFALSQKSGGAPNFTNKNGTIRQVQPDLAPDAFSPTRFDHFHSQPVVVVATFITVHLRHVAVVDNEDV